MNFNSDIFGICMDVAIMGIGLGFTIGFISWAIGYAIYSVIKWIRLA